MKTIHQDQKIAFNAITFKDAITLLPLMDALSEMIDNNRKAKLYESLPKEEQDKYKRVWTTSQLHIPAESAERIYFLLNSLGFESQECLWDVEVQDLDLK